MDDKMHSPDRFLSCEMKEMRRGVWRAVPVSVGGRMARIWGRQTRGLGTAGRMGKGGDRSDMDTVETSPSDASPWSRSSCW